MGLDPRWNDTNYSNGTYNNSYDYLDDYTPITDRPETYIVPVIFGLIFVVSKYLKNTKKKKFLEHLILNS